MRKSRIVGLSIAAAAAISLPFLTSASRATAAGAVTTSGVTKTACPCDYGGTSVATSGTTALMGVPGIDDAAGRAYVYTDTGGGWTQTAVLAGTDTAPGDNFGASVAISGTIAVVGAPQHDSFAGSAYVFAEAAGAWTQVAELRGSDTAAGDWFGGSVAIDAMTAVVGAPVHAGNLGSAYVFTGTGTGWTQVAEFRGGAAQGDFGYSVAVSATTAIVGAPGVPTGSGNAFVFSDTSGTWLAGATLAGPKGGLHDFGSSVALDGTTAVVGAWIHTAGAAYVFTGASGTWTRSAPLPASGNPKGFGAAVAVSGTTVAVSAVNSSGNNGSVSVYNPSAGAWAQTAQLVPARPANGDFFGSRAVALSGTTLVAGAPGHGAIGAAFVFTATQTTGAWSQVADLSDSDSNTGDKTGASVAIGSASVVVGAPGHDGEGRAYVFRTPPPWLPVFGLEGADTAPGDGFGDSVAVAGTTVLVGAPDNGGTGRAYVFAETTDPPYTLGAVRAPNDAVFYSPPDELQGSAAGAGADFGASVALSGTTAIIGAPGGPTGTAYVFTDNAGTWTQTAQLEGTGTDFGASVALSGTTAIVGAPGGPTGTADVFTGAGTGTGTGIGTWTQTAQLQATGSDFGASVALSGSTAIIGAPGGPTDTAYAFTDNAGTWSQPAPLTGSGTAAGADFGTSVALSGTTAVIGAPGGSSTGAAYVFTQTAGTWTQGAQLGPSGKATGADFGASVAILGTTAVVGAPGFGGMGSAFVFSPIS